MTDIAQLHFLVVEDQGFQRWLIANTLKDFGARSVVAAAGGAEALKLLAEAPVDVAISDLDMPEMDGMELIRRIAALGHPVCVVLVSSHDRSLMASVESMAAAYNVKVLGTIQKPLTARKLEAALASLDVRRAAIPVRPAAILVTAAEVEAGLLRGEFEAHFQPKVDLRTGRIRGAEALARWRHPGQGLLAPVAFMPAVQTSGMMETLTRVVLTDAVRNCVEWRKAGIAGNVSVNLSVLSLSDVKLADRVAAMVAEGALEPAHVTFEVTESAAMREEGPALENLSRLRMKGFGLSIDDYGTGYSSMERLARIPFTELKIDQSFVSKATTDSSSRAIVESSLELARKLGIAAVAEGVESAAQWSLLQSLDCELAQGYYVSAALNGAEFRRWARSRVEAAAP
ncbi:MAG TPA: EAL domain-containing response regulator [Usitatibacter sp.]|nr:EAL domain-containing response regulator [Usitatibacter sp.]